jgi:AmpD protein
MTIEHGWLAGVRRVPSPNFNTRPAGVIVRLLVVHNISLPPGEFGGPYIEQLFSNKLDQSIHPYFETIATLEVSAHLLIRRDGELIQFVSFDDRAWHAGSSMYQGVKNCNDFAIGIELEGTDNLPYTGAQYEALVIVSRLLLEAYPHMEGHIAGHCDISPGRKTDPGDAFDWDRYLGNLVNKSENTSK